MSDPKFVFATHPKTPSKKSSTRGRVLHIKKTDTHTICNMLITETPFSISLGYGFEEDPDDRPQCQLCVRKYNDQTR